MASLTRMAYGFGLALVVLLTSYHFYLPYHTQWEQSLHGTLPHLVWALMLLNFAWSLITLLFAMMMFVFLHRPHVASRTKQIAASVFAFYWLIHSAWVALNPMPLPPSLGYIQPAMVGFSVLTAGLMALGWQVFRQNNTD